MPLLFLAMYSYWWKALSSKKQVTNVIILMPEDDAPELTVTTFAPPTYQG
jgi:hypothetical protein